MRLPIDVLYVALLVPVSLSGERLPAAVMSCAELASLALPKATITKAEAAMSNSSFASQRHDASTDSRP